jgi:uncharacterized membrane protein YqiK
MNWQTWLMIGGGIFLLVIGIFALIARFYRKVEQGKALIVNKLRDEPEVTFTGDTVWPIFHKAELMDISVKKIEIDRRGKEGLICMDNIRADIKVTFFVRVNKTREDVLKVAQAIGCARASQQETLEELFNAKFSEALKTVGKLMEFEDLYKERREFRDKIIQTIGTDLNGYALEDVAIDYLEQTPLSSLDPANILDAQGIKKITEITTKQNVLTNDLKQTERKEIKRQNVAADEAVFELDRQRADAESKQLREIATVRAREAAETAKVQAEEKARAEKARIKSEEEVKIEEENKERQVQVAGKNRERVVGVENERVEKDRVLEQIAKERAVELQRIEKEKALEVEKKAIADVVRDRVAVEKTVAEEEERIKDVHVLAEANRVKESTRIHAEAEAVEAATKHVKAAEAKEEAAKHAARERLTLAAAALEAADKEAQAQIRMAEGTQAVKAAPGLADAKVKEADAIATEKLGLANVRVKEADANAIEKVGLAEVRVKEANADAVQKLGLAEATVEREKLVAEATGTKEKLLAEATGEQEKGMAGVRVKEAEAGAVEKRGLAEGVAIREKLVAEAGGLAEKAKAMKDLDGVGRDHEEFRLRLDKEKAVDLASIAVRKEIAEAQAHVLSSAFSNARFNIVGGDGEFFERFQKSVSLGLSVDGAIHHSEALTAAARDYLSGEASLPEDVKQVLSRPALSPADLQSLSVAAVLGKLAAGADAPLKGKLEALLAKAKELGLDGLTPR